MDESELGVEIMNYSKVSIGLIAMKTIIKILCLLCLPSLLLAANKPDLFLLKTYDDKKSVVGWMMSEKFDPKVLSTT
jgi:hypothetical protein